MTVIQVQSENLNNINNMHIIEIFEGEEREIKGRKLIQRNNGCKLS